MSSFEDITRMSSFDDKINMWPFDDMPQCRHSTTIGQLLWVLIFIRNGQF